MTAIHPTEIRPGLAVTLDPAILARDPDTRVNGRLVDSTFWDWRPLPFIVLERRPNEGSWLLAHCSLNSGEGRRELRRSMKRGSQWWTAQAGYCQVDSCWIVTTEAIVAACNDPTRVGARNRYAGGNGDPERQELESIASEAREARPGFEHPILPTLAELTPAEMETTAASLDDAAPVQVDLDEPSEATPPTEAIDRGTAPHAYDEAASAAVGDLLARALSGEVLLDGGPRGLSLTGLVRRHREAIAALRAKGATWAQVSELLGRAGIDVEGKTLGRLFNATKGG